MRAHFVERHRRQLQSRKKICAQSLKMMAHETAHFAGRFFRAEGDLDVMKSETPIFPKNEPGAEAQRVSKCKRSPQWQKTNQGKTCAVNKINEILEHRSRPARSPKAYSVNLPGRRCYAYNVARSSARRLVYRWVCTEYRT